MELWVRSQDKERLLKIKDIFLDYNGYHCNEFHLITYDDKKYEITLGTYKTKERALEVLDEIQRKINLINLGHDFGSPMIDLDNPTYVYQMPEE